MVKFYRNMAKGKVMIYLLRCELLGGMIFYIASLHYLYLSTGWIGAMLCIDISLFP